MFGTQQSKYKKYHKQKIRLKSTVQGLCEPTYGACSLRSKEAGRMAACHFDSARKTIRRHVKRSGKIWFIGGPVLPVTKKPNTIRMGKGKGGVDFWCRPSRSGSNLVELSGPNPQHLLRVMSIVQKKMPVRSNILWSTQSVHY